MAEEQQESSQGEMEGVNCLAYDEAIIAQQDRIQQEIATSNPLVSDRQPLTVLQNEYAQDDTIYQLKIKNVSDYVVVYLRLLTSGYLQREHAFFQHFIEGGRSVKEFCQQESDHIHIIALAQALNVSILVEYMDRGEGGTVNHHVFPEGSVPRIFLLYRPGHYDI
ncbi:hypothetical protein CRUP_022996, partial [Coryphaenoides rupestris]